MWNKDNTVFDIVITEPQRAPKRSCNDGFHVVHLDELKIEKEEIEEFPFFPGRLFKPGGLKIILPEFYMGCD